MPTNEKITFFIVILVMILLVLVAVYYANQGGYLSGERKLLEDSNPSPPKVSTNTNSFLDAEFFSTLFMRLLLRFGWIIVIGFILAVSRRSRV